MTDLKGLIIGFIILGIALMLIPAPPIGDELLVGTVGAIQAGKALLTGPTIIMKQNVSGVWTQ